jgi:hypothetical protein
MVMEKKSQTLVMTVMARKKQALKKYQLQFLKVLMMEQELD